MQENGQEINAENFINKVVSIYNMDNKDKVKIQIKRDVLQELLKRKKVGETYSDTIERELNLVPEWKKWIKK